MGPTGDIEIDTKYANKGDGSTMRALAWFGNQDVRMIDAPAPAITNVGHFIFLEKGRAD